ncbi:DEKNAAC100498 [Brettanomyces naardenensis]|uniref:DEKNAAC100498 n=1 Tax=Brettanomyces naardenensis TaxID=13370 RepID=A0A448YF58_BRENA|nr:DEKNAAC100498 [Brettanomyces naardenensis]
MTYSEWLSQDDKLKGTEDSPVPHGETDITEMIEMNDLAARLGNSGEVGSSLHSDEQNSVNGEPKPLDDETDVTEQQHSHPLHFTSGDCTICLETFTDADEVRGLSCGHVFHVECIDPWLTNRRACCPTCKRDFLEEEEESTRGVGNPDFRDLDSIFSMDRTPMSPIVYRKPTEFKAKTLLCCMQLADLGRYHTDGPVDLGDARRSDGEEIESRQHQEHSGSEHTVTAPATSAAAADAPIADHDAPTADADSPAADGTEDPVDSTNDAENVEDSSNATDSIPGTTQTTENNRPPHSSNPYSSSFAPGMARFVNLTSLDGVYYQRMSSSSFESPPLPDITELSPKICDILESHPFNTLDVSGIDRLAYEATLRLFRWYSVPFWRLMGIRKLDMYYYFIVWFYQKKKDVRVAAQRRERHNATNEHNEEEQEASPEGPAASETPVNRDAVENLV